jgi:hypothetical protein
MRVGLARSCCHSIKLAARGGRGHRPHARLSRNRQQAQPNCGRIAPSAARLRDPRINSDASFRARNATSPVHPEGVHMSRLMVLTLACVAGASLATSSLRAEQDQDQVTPQAVVSALEGAYGVHPGERRNHTKGMCALGTFVGLPEAATYSRSGLFAGSSIPVVARFSLAGGNPEASDTENPERHGARVQAA